MAVVEAMATRMVPMELIHRQQAALLAAGSVARLRQAALKALVVAASVDLTALPEPLSLAAPAAPVKCAAAPARCLFLVVAAVAAAFWAVVVVVVDQQAQHLVVATTRALAGTSHHTARIS